VAAALTSRGASKDLQATSAIAGRKWMLLLACLPSFYKFALPFWRALARFSPVFGQPIGKTK